MGQQILLVEDHHDTASAFSRMLQRDGYGVVVARSAAEAADLCAEHTFDLLICDLQLPDGDGSGLLQLARVCRPRTMGIVVSGNDQPSGRQRAREAGFAHFFLKPIDYVSLHRTMAELLANG